MERLELHQEPPGLTFDPAPHVYQLDGVRLPSVTTIIKGAFPELYLYSTEFARDRGRYVHECVHELLRGRLDIDKISPLAEGFVRAAANYIAAHPTFELIASERRVVSKTHHYAGTLDVLCRIDGVPTVVDWKTGDPGWQAELQLAAYANALHELYGFVVARRIAVWLREDGTFKQDVRLVTHQRADFADFIAAYRVAKRRGTV